MKRTAGTRRKLGAEDSATRSALLDAAEHLMRVDGYAAVSSRRVGQQAGLKPQLVHYYFRNMDALFLGVWQRFVERLNRRQQQLLGSHQPVRALWNFASNREDTSLVIEFMALGRHRKAVRQAIARQGEGSRRRLTALFTQMQRSAQYRHMNTPPGVLAVMIAGISRVMVMESELGIASGHAATRRFVQNWLARMESPAARRARR